MDNLNPADNNENREKKPILYSLSGSNSNDDDEMESLPYCTEFNTFPSNVPTQLSDPKNEQNYNNPPFQNVFTNSDETHTLHTDIPSASHMTSNIPSVVRNPLMTFKKKAPSFPRNQRLPRDQRCCTGIKMPIAGIQIEFPYQPYPVQKYMMNMLIAAIKKAQNCLLESPTGTGKTLALLCSTLAWQEHERKMLESLAETAMEVDKNPIDAKRKNNEEKKNEETSSKRMPEVQGQPSESMDTLSDSDDGDIFQPKRTKVLATTVNSGPQGVELKGVYENVNTYRYQDEVGRAILETSRVVPHGVLCFFQSYYLMEKLRDRWTSTGLMDSLEELKDVFWEPRRKQDMDSIMEEFTTCIQESSANPDNNHGAVMFGVFRGKIAEGIDFNDDNARAVIAVGIPFMNKNVMEIKLKMKFNDENRGQLLSGSRWYEIQAYRALNQALGRCIRHKDDWGAIILLDARFSSHYVMDNLPAWIKKGLRSFEVWRSGSECVADFCKERVSEDDQTKTSRQENK